MTILHHQSQGGGPPVLVLHGLFGSATNWRGVARQLADRYRVVTVDLRNHGRSPQHAEMTYPLMARDVEELMDALGLERAAVVGHSMGGKAAMVLSLTHPQRVDRLAVVDIAPVRYTHTHAPLIAAMQGLDLSVLRSRADADRLLRDAVPDTATRLFLLQNLALEQGRYFWRLNLNALSVHLDDIMGFPSTGSATYEGPVMFLRGEHSDYVTAEHREPILERFPLARIVTVEGAGHWVHADQPDRLVNLVQDFLG